MEDSNILVLLISLAVVVVVLLAVPVGFALAYSILRRSQTHPRRADLNELEDAVERSAISLKASHSCVPPMRIHLEKAENDAGSFGSRGALAERWLRGNEFRYLGQFIIEEMQDEHLRAFVHPELPVLGVIRFPTDQALPYVEFSMLLDGPELVGVANPPLTTLQLPDDMPGAYFYEELSVTLLERMWAEVERLSVELSTIEVPQDEVAFAELYEEAHAAEMDYRLECGGLSEREIIDTFRQQGLVASPADIDRIQQQWQEAIEMHLLDYSTHASNCHYSGRKVLIVHEGSQRGYLIAKLGNLLIKIDSIAPGTAVTEREDLRTQFNELMGLLERFSPREAVARFRALLPQELRYDLVDQLKIPVEADCYVLPTN